MAYSIRKQHEMGIMSQDYQTKICLDSLTFASMSLNQTTEEDATQMEGFD